MEERRRTAGRPNETSPPPSPAHSRYGIAVYRPPNPMSRPSRCRTAFLRRNLRPRPLPVRRRRATYPDRADCTGDMIRFLVRSAGFSPDLLLDWKNELKPALRTKTPQL